MFYSLEKKATWKLILALGIYICELMLGRPPFQVSDRARADANAMLTRRVFRRPTR